MNWRVVSIICFFVGFGLFLGSLPLSVVLPGRGSGASGVETMLLMGWLCMAGIGIPFTLSNLMLFLSPLFFYRITNKYSPWIVWSYVISSAISLIFGVHLFVGLGTSNRMDLVEHGLAAALWPASLVLVSGSMILAGVKRNRSISRP